VRKFIDHANLRRPPEDGFGIHFLELDAAIFDLPARNDFQAFDLLNGVFSPMRLEIPNDDIGPLLFQFLRFLEHPVRFAGSSRVTEKYLQTAAPRGIRPPHAVVLCGKTRTSIPSARSMRRSTGFPRNRCQKPVLELCPIKICVMPISRASVTRALAGSRRPSKTLMLALTSRAIARFSSSLASSSTDKFGWRTYATNNSPWNRSAFRRPLSRIGRASDRGVMPTRIRSCVPQISSM